MLAETEIDVGNRLLAALPRDEFKNLEPHLELIYLPLTEILFRPGERTQYVYFPQDSIVSLLTDLSDGGGAEVGLVGREGMVGLSVVLQVATESKIATVQAQGSFSRISADTLREALKRGGKLQTFSLQYTNGLMSQISQSAVCNIRHNAERRLARWILMYQDRIDSRDLPLTHEFMSNMLGIRRAGVTEVACKLQSRGLISYTRGRVTILDLAGLEGVACECYSIVKQEFAGLYTW